jgi:threonine aldolase
MDNGDIAVRICTSWATRTENVNALLEEIGKM